MSTPILAWEKFWAASGAASAAPDLLGELLLAWTEPQRHYHTLQHLAECLLQLETCWAQAERPGELCLALFFHDAIHDPHASHNEARSAAWAQHAMQTAGFAPEAARRVHDMVLATCHSHMPDAPVDTDTALLLDIDLAILGADTPRFMEYETQVRAEYAWVTEPAWQTARSEVLQGFLDRTRIYRSESFHARLEQSARRNLQGALLRLQAAGGIQRSA